MFKNVIVEVKSCIGLTMSSFRSSTFLFLLFNVFVLTTCMNDASHRRKCYDISDKSYCYFLAGTINVGSGTKWLDAWKVCRSSNATLPIILDEAMQNIFQNFVDSLSIDYTEQPENKVKFWLAGREVRKGEWIWNGIDSSEEVKYSNWNDGHGYQSRKECMASTHRSPGQSKWDQVPCDYSRPFIICQTGPRALSLELEPPQASEGLASFTTPAVTGGVVLIVIIIVVIVVIITVVKKRSAKKDAQKDRGYQNLHHGKQERENSGIRPYTKVDLCLPEGFDVDPYHNEAPQLSIRQSQLHDDQDHFYHSIDDYAGPQSDNRNQGKHSYIDVIP